MSLAIINCRKIYAGRAVVNGVDMEILPGEIVGLLGPNGAGKTTTFYSIVGMISPEEGRIILDGRDITDMPMYMRSRTGIGYLPQESSIFRRLTVEDNLNAVIEHALPNAHKNRRTEIVRELLESFGIYHLRKSQARLLSGGEKRRLEIARSLVSSPRYMLLDEPFVGIDPITTVEIQNIVYTLKKRGLGILITDHNVRQTLEIIDKAYIMYEGRILLSGTAEQLLSSEEARKVYLGDRFTLT